MTNNNSHSHSHSFSFTHSFSAPFSHSSWDEGRAPYSKGKRCSITKKRKPTADRGRFLQIAYGSSLECAAIIDVLLACKVIDKEDNTFGKQLLNRIVSMLIKMIERMDRIGEETAEYGENRFE